jgi:hypothetical protein
MKNITAAPWKVSDYYHGSIVNEIGQRICSNLKWQSEARANGLLIAAAPELLSALIDLVAQVEDMPNPENAEPWLTNAKNAIKTAQIP